MDYDIRSLQLKMLEVLLAIDKVCKEHNLKYYIAYGTLLGAVRYKGFIPWDDDLDIMMPRSDYELLVKNWKLWLPEPYEFVCVELNPEYSNHYGKIQDSSTTLVERDYRNFVGGIFVDVFPIDCAPELPKRKKYNKKFKRLKKIRHFLYRDPYRHGHGPSCWYPLLLRKLFTREKITSKIKALVTEFDLEKSDYVAIYSGDVLDMFPKKDLGEPTPIKFENHYVMGMTNNTGHLIDSYGPDYMTPPPADKIFQHKFWYVDLNLPYREYHKQYCENK